MEMIKAITTKRAKAKYKYIVPINSGVVGGVVVALETPKYYNKGRRGLNYSLFEFGEFAVAVGAYPIGNVTPTSSYLSEWEYDTWKVLRDNTLTTPQKRKQVKEIIVEYLNNLIN